jgi:outer membrane protein
MNPHHEIVFPSSEDNTFLHCRSRIMSNRIKTFKKHRRKDMRKIFPLFVLVLIFGTLSAFAQEESAEQAIEELTLVEYLDLVKATHPYFMKEQLTVEIEQKQAQSLLGAEDWFLSIVPTYTYLGKSSAPEYGASQIHRGGIEAGLDRALWSTGGRLGFGVTTSYTRQDRGSGFENLYRNGIEASYTQPLLQNWAGTLDRLEYELSDFTIDYTQVQVYENQENFLLDVSIRFLDWAYFAREVAIREERLEIAKRGLEDVNKRYKANLVDKVDVLRSEDSVRLSEQGLVLAQSQWKAKQAELAVIADNDELFRRKPMYDIYRLEELPANDEVMMNMKSQSRLLKTFDILKKQLLYQRGGVEDQERAQLDLSVTAGLYGRNEAFGESLEIYQPEAIVSLIFAKPLGSTTAKGQIGKIEKQIAQIDEEKKSLERDLEASMINLLIQIRDLEDVLDLNRKQIESAQEKTKEELKLYNQGRSELTFVIQSEDNEEAAKLTYAGNAYLYQTLILQYLALLDDILVVE